MRNVEELFNLKPSRSRIIDGDEMIRYMHALYRYTNSKKRIVSVLDDFAYGIFPVRNLNWVKNKIQRICIILESEDTFIDTIRKIKEWSPDMFTWKQRMAHLNSHGIRMNNKQIEIYQKLVSQDINSWWEDSFHSKLAAESAHEIFYKIVKNATNCKYMSKEILRWSETKFLFTPPSRVNQALKTPTSLQRDEK